MNADKANIITPAQIRAVLENTIELSNDYDFGPWTEASDWREEEENAAQTFLTSDFKQAILNSVEHAADPWSVVEPLFDFMGTNDSFKELEEFLSAIIRNRCTQKIFKKLINGIVSMIKKAEDPGNILRILNTFALKKNIKLLREHPDIMEIIRGIIKKRKQHHRFTF